MNSVTETLSESLTQTLKTFDREDVLEKCIKYFNGDELAAQIWMNKYMLKDSHGNIYEDSPKMMHDRIASELFRIESRYKNPMSLELLQNLLYDFKYIIPQGSPMSGIGNDFQIVSLSNCFVIGNDGDSYGGIMKTDQEQVQLMKRRGGVGHDLSGIRPTGSPVKNSALTSTGIVPFMERYSNSTREVAQDGRRGALMLSISTKHPNSGDFIDAKLDGTKITGANVSIKAHDDFMKAVIGNKKYTQQYPIDSDNPSVIREVDAKEMWDKVIHNAWKSAEPGVLYWDKIISESLPDRYADLGYKTVSTNPCVVGDTKIAVADGRGSVSIEQLAKEGNDVPVYALDNEGEIVVKTMRNPRVTGYNQKIYKISIEGGHEFRVTGNHQIRLKDGSYKRAEDIIHGDSLHIMSKVQYNTKSNSYLMVVNKGKSKPDHSYISEFERGTELVSGEVVHHIDYNGLNNDPKNLAIMTKEDHNYLHSKDMIGDKNPYHTMSDQWKKKFASHPGESNPNYSGVDNELLISHMILLTKEMGRRVSVPEWKKYSKENALPQFFSNFRKDGLDTMMTLSKKVALELGYEYVDIDPRLVKTYEKMLENGYNCDIIDGKVVVEKVCETCDDTFEIEHRKREVSFCSHKCSLEYVNNNEEINNRRTESINNTFAIKAEEVKENQLKMYSNLMFKLNREPLLKEWESECATNNVPFRLRTKHGFDDFAEIKAESEYYNHKVISVELDGYEDVYNGTVDDVHNYFSGMFESKTRTGNPKFICVNQMNCGEIPLCPDDSCRLLAINLLSYVINPFTKSAEFDFELFKEHAGYALRMMDDIIDLEIEKIDRIIEKIKSDPEEESIKRVELELWERIQKKCNEGRRTGVGITAEGDMLAAMGLTYGTKKATKFATEVHRTYAIEVFRSSMNLARERGTFKVWDSSREQDHPFLLRIKEYDEELYNDLMKYGRRNIACLTIAPTGSVSILSQTTSGIEPAFMVSYKRRRKINPNDKHVKSDFVDEVGDHWQEYNVYHHGFKRWIEITGHKYLSEDEKLLSMEQYDKSTIDKLIEKSPYYKAMANDVDWVEKVRMQGSIQEWIDHSISVTVNLPEDVTEELVNDVYIMAWKSGCKGCTIYRDGSRSGVLISNEEKKDQDTHLLFAETNAPKRPAILECDVMTFQNKGEKWIGFLGLLEGRPYEIFTGALDNFPIPGWIDKGSIIRTKNKNGDSNYDFIYLDKSGREMRIPNLNHAFDEKYYDMAKTFSAILRHGMPISYVIELIGGLNLDGDLLSTWKAGVKRMLKKFVKDGTQKKGKCEECGSESLEYKEGCLTCIECGGSKCSS